MTACFYICHVFDQNLNTTITFIYTLKICVICPAPYSCYEMADRLCHCGLFCMKSIGYLLKISSYNEWQCGHRTSLGTERTDTWHDESNKPYWMILWKIGQDLCKVKHAWIHWICLIFQTSFKRAAMRNTNMKISCLRYLRLSSWAC